MRTYTFNVTMVNKQTGKSLTLKRRYTSKARAKTFTEKEFPTMKVTNVYESDECGGGKVTDFQQRIIQFLKAQPMTMESTWVIAQGAFPEKWAHRSGRGALIGHIDRAGQKVGLTRLPPKDQYGEAVFALPEELR